LLSILIIISGCKFQIDDLNLSNPASKFCIENGGNLEIRSINSSQVGFCVFDDGLECDEWAYYRGECDNFDNCIFKGW
jgi:putative hemolysin